FVYVDFNDTTGIVFNGDAGTTVCRDDEMLRYGDVQGKADLFDEGGSSIERGETTDLTFESTVETNLAIYNEEIEKYLSGFLHRGFTVTSPSTCKGRVRLTPSGPAKAGSIWFRDDVPVNNGFDTYFTFQISDHSKECTVHKDQYFTQRHHRTCSVRGGDGFAFVIQNGPDNTAALGANGGQMGFGGLQNSVAIAFDTWQNPGDDLFGVDHVSFQSRGRTATNDGLDAGLLGIPRVAELADGSVHLVRIAYFSDLRAEYLDYLVASESIIPYLLDNGEQKRIGTLVVFIDKGVETGTPLMAMPINLSLLLDLPTDKAFVGFTSSTGRFFEKHDLLSWYFCNEEPCITEHKLKFDYHQESKFNANAILRQSLQGEGYGGGMNSEGFPSRHSSPDTRPWQKPMAHFASGRSHGLSATGDMQVPPYTLY
ncbi:unnamed protein product, partial [Symbiodinium microadriaticum]